VKQVPGIGTAFTLFSIDTSAMFGPAAAGTEEEFERTLRPQERGWIFDEVGGEYSAEELISLAVRLAPCLRTAERLHETIRQWRAGQKTRRPFDFEISLEGSPSATTPNELAFSLHWLKARGHAAQLAAPDPGRPEELARNLPALAAICRRYQCTLSLGARPEYGPEMLALIARATAGRFHYRIAAPPVEPAAAITAAAEHLVG
jgi:hypothetical protein